MLMFKLADEHPLTKAGLRCIHVVEKAGLGLRSGDIVFEFPLGHIVDTGMACRRDGIIPPEIDIMTIHKEANATRADCNQKLRKRKGLARPGLIRYATEAPAERPGLPCQAGDCAQSGDGRIWGSRRLASHSGCGVCRATAPMAGLDEALECRKASHQGDACG